LHADANAEDGATASQSLLDDCTAAHGCELTNDGLECANARHDKTIGGFGGGAIRRQRHSCSNKFERLGGGVNIA
jgi:hypothetical protein